MKTSQQQFDILLAFMTQHGDLNKPKTCAKGRISQIHLWETLTSLLNASGSGDPRTTQQWKKVWSDLKNNTKKKAARIARVATGTGGGPALKTSLNDMEEKVLQMMGTQAATGLNVEEAGLPLETESPVYLVEVVDASTASSAPTPSILRTPPNVPPPMSPLHYINSPNRMVITPTNTPCRILPSLSGHSPIRSHSRSPHNNNPEQHATAPPRFSLSDSQPRHGSPAQPRRRHNATRRRVSQMPYHEQATADFMSVDAAWRKLRIERMRVQDKQTEIWQTLAQDALNLFREYLTRQA